MSPETSREVPGAGVAEGKVVRRERIERIFRRGLEASRRDYDPARHLVGGPAPWARGRAGYRPPMSLWLAHALLRDGGGEHEREAAAIVAAALESQERSAHHPHRGNFLWLADDEEVVDLNAVQFMLRALLPLLLEYGDRLPPDLSARCREAVRLALDEQERMAVAPTYTNIHLMSLFSLVVGGEWLDDAHFLDLGRARWDAWVAFTAGSGAPHEYNSPGYGAIDLGALAALHRYVRDPRVKLQARLFYERIWLHLALHFHRPTGLHAGPHCRCYWFAMAGGRAGLHDLLWRETGHTFFLGDLDVQRSATGTGAGRSSSTSGGAPQPSTVAAAPVDGVGQAAHVPASLELALTDHWLPEVVRSWIERQSQALPVEVRETSNRAEGADLTTYLTSGYALGTASRTYSIGQDDFYIEHQANHLLLQYARLDRDEGPKTNDEGAAGGVRPSSSDFRRSGWGMLYSRYVVNDRHYGALTAAPDRPPNAFYDQGHFAGVQLRNKAIALYALQPQHEEVFSLKTVIAFRQAQPTGAPRSGGQASGGQVSGGQSAAPPVGLDEVWAEDRRVTSGDLPVHLTPGDWLVVADGAVYVGVRPLVPSCLGREAPILLDRGPDGELWLTIYNYRGPAKRFWDYASLRGAFWRGNLRAGYVLEVAPRDDYPSAAAFLAHLRRATIGDTAGPAGESPLVRTVTYRSGADALELRYDLWHTRPLGRRLNGTVYDPPALASPWAAQGSTGEVRAGSAVLQTGPQPVWLIAQELDPAARAWIAVNPQNAPTTVRLETPLGVVTAARWGAGRIEWRAPAGGEQTLVLDTLELPDDLRFPEGVRLVRSGAAQFSRSGGNGAKTP